MSAWIVYSKDGLTERCELHAVEYGGTHMGERAVTATFESDSKVDFDIFDYLSYRGEVFELESAPTVKKTSSFEYSYELRFVSRKYELERCEMRDLVPSDNGVVYPTPLSFSFTGDVRYLTDRIQACLDDLYGEGVWNIVIADGVESEEKNITIAQQNCWNALALVNSTYGLDFYIKGRVITIGGSQPVVSHVFEYGKGNGLYEIERAVNTDTAIVTKLRAYGSDRNLDYSYPKKPEWSDSNLPVSFAFSPLRLMLPSFKVDKTDYVLADEETIKKYGIREASIVYEDIYPSITGATHNGQAIDEIKAVDVVDDNASTFVVYLHDLGFDLEEHLTTTDAQISMKSGAMQGYTFTISNIEKQYEKAATFDISNEENPKGETPEEDLGEFVGYKITLNRMTADGGENYNIPNSDWNMREGDKFVLLNILMPQKYIREAENRLKQRAEEYLAEYSKTNFGYNIGLHDKFLIENPSVYDALIEGSKLSVYDEELGISEDVTIQSITITENAADNTLPQVKVTLNNEPSASTLDRIQGKIDSLANESAANNFATQSEIMAQYRKKLDKPFFDKLFAAVDAEGNEIPSTDTVTPVAYIKARYDFAVVGGVTMYLNDGSLDLPSIFEEIPFDNKTIWLNPETKLVEVIGSTEEDEGDADFSNVKTSGEGNAFTSFVLSEDSKELTFVKGETFAKQSDFTALNTKVTDFLEGSDTDGYILIMDDDNLPSVITKEDTVYEVRYNYDLNGATLNVPKGCVLKFNGGSINGGTIVGDHTCIEAEAVRIFSATTKIEGTWNVLEGYPEWFGAKADGTTDDAPYIQKCMDSFDVTRLHNKTYLLNSIQNAEYGACLNLPAGKKFKGSLTKSTLTDDNGTLKVGSSITPSVIVYIGSKCHLSDMNIRGNSMSNSTLKQTGVKTFTGAYNNISNVGVVGSYYGFDVCAFMSTIEGCTSAYNYIGFYVRGIISSSDTLLAENTSIFMKNCYAVDSYAQGYYFRGLIYSTIVSCGADGCGWQGYTKPITSGRRVETYWIRECRGVSFIGCGMEQATKALRFSSSLNCSFKDSVFILKTSEIADDYSFNNTFVFGYSQNILLENIRIKHDGRTFTSSDKLFYFESASSSLEYAKIVNIQNLYDGNLYDVMSFAGMGTVRYDCVDIREANFRRRIGASNLRPTLSAYEKGEQFYDETTKRLLYWDGSVWRDNTTKDIVPDTNEAYSIGSTDKQYKSVHSKELNVGGIPITKYQDGVLYIDGNLAIKGDVTTFAIGAQKVADIMDAIEVDEETISKKNGYLEVIGGSGGGTMDDSKYPKLNGALGSSSDLNNATRAGYYKVGLCDNMPDGLYPYGMLEVIEVYTGNTDKESRIAQVYYPHAVGNGYTEAALAVRLRNDGTWTNWRISPTENGNVASATKATKDGSGNVITSTYLTKTDASNTYLGKNAKAASATSADTATNLTSAPSFSGSKAITITVGGKSSSSFTVPYATKAGSVDTADSLTNSVSIWGQTFDGSGDIDGDIDDVGDITPKSDDTYSLGSSSYSWSDVWTSLVNLPATENAFSMPGIKFGSKGRIGVNSSGQVGIYGLGTSSGIYLRPKCTTSGVSTVGAVIDAAGNLSITGTLSQTSDERKKTILNHVSLSLEEIAEAPLIEHYYNCDDAKTTHVGSIAQYWAGLNDWFCKKDDEGYYSMEVQNCALASAISIARELVKCKKEIEDMKSEIEKMRGA